MTMAGNLGAVRTQTQTAERRVQLGASGLAILPLLRGAAEHLFPAADPTVHVLLAPLQPIEQFLIDFTLGELIAQPLDREFGRLAGEFEIRRVGLLGAAGGGSTGSLSAVFPPPWPGPALPLFPEGLWPGPAFEARLVRVFALGAGRFGSIAWRRERRRSSRTGRTVRFGRSAFRLHDRRLAGPTVSLPPWSAAASPPRRPRL